MIDIVNHLVLVESTVSFQCLTMLNCGCGCKRTLAQIKLTLRQNREFSIIPKAGDTLADFYWPMLSANSIDLADLFGSLPWQILFCRPTFLGIEHVLFLSADVWNAALWLVALCWYYRSIKIGQCVVNKLTNFLVGWHKISGQLFWSSLATLLLNLISW